MAIVNYVREHRRFIRYASDNKITASEFRLWYALFEVFNDESEGNIWPDGFIHISNNRLLTLCDPMGIDTMVRARNGLKQRGLIEFRPGNKNKENPSYRMKLFYPDGYTQNANNNPESYAQNAYNMGGNMGGNAWGNMGGNMPANMGNIYINQNKGYTETNPKENDTHTEPFTAVPRARGRLDEEYMDSAGTVRPCRFDGAFQTSDRARMAVVQRILNRFTGDMDSENAHFRLAEFLHDGMPPEILEDEIGKYSSLRKYVAAMAAIFHNRGYEEKRDALEMQRCREAARGNERMAQFLYRNSGRFVPEEEPMEG